MGLYSAYGTDQKAEQNGKWIDFPPANDDGTTPRFLLARMGRTNPAYQSRVEKLSKEKRRELELDILDERVSRTLLLDIFADTVLLGWENVQDRDNTDIPYSPENARRLLTDLPDVYDVLIDMARKVATFRASEIEAGTKN